MLNTDQHRWLRGMKGEYISKICYYVLLFKYSSYCLLVDKFCGINTVEHVENYIVFQVVGFDSVDDESKADLSMFNSDSPTPDLWCSSKNPPYR